MWKNAQISSFSQISGKSLKLINFKKDFIGTHELCPIKEIVYLKLNRTNECI